MSGKSPKDFPDGGQMGKGMMFSGEVNSPAGGPHKEPKKERAPRIRKVIFRRWIVFKIA